MEGVFSVLVPFALAAVGLVLLAGLVNMLRGGSPNLSQTLMRWRVVLQFIAIIMIMTAIYVASQPGQHGAAEPGAAETEAPAQQPEPLAEPQAPGE